MRRVCRILLAAGLLALAAGCGTPPGVPWPWEHARTNDTGQVVNPPAYTNEREAPHVQR